jgi:hypothetical protein
MSYLMHTLLTITASLSNDRRLPVHGAIVSIRTLRFPIQWH